MSKIGKLLGIKPPQAPDMSAQKKQEERLAKQEADLAKEKKANRAVIAGRSGRGQGVTLNPNTGERGVTSAKLGGDA